MNLKLTFLLFFIGINLVVSQSSSDESILTLDRIYSDEFRQESMPAFQWVENGNAYIILEDDGAAGQSVIKYRTSDQERSEMVTKIKHSVGGQTKRVESVSLSKDESKLLQFYNSKRVWRSNTKGDYVVYNFKSDEATYLGESLPDASLMFAKFSDDNKYVAYISDFNIYKENFETGEITQLTFDGTGDIINGTFDWVYEEEFGCRDGFRWRPDGSQIAYWQLDASAIGTHYMINNTDSIYSTLIPLQYPKVGQDPSSCKVGLVDATTQKTEWIQIPGDPVQHYIPRMQWITNDLLLIQQMNRKQNTLIYWNYNPDTKELKEVYREVEKTWIDIDYPDASSAGWGMYDLDLIDDVKVVRLTETDGWRHAYLIDLEKGTKELLTPEPYDVASVYGNDGQYLYYSASPDNSTQRYLYRVGLDGKGKSKRMTPKKYSGINRYKFAPNGKYAFHTHNDVNTPSTTRLIKVGDHSSMRTYVKNEDFSNKYHNLSKGEVRWETVTIDDDLETDVRMVLPPGFDASLKYPVIFHVYGEPWGQVAKDDLIGLWDRYLSQQGYIIIDMDNRGTPCLKGSNWRKSIYRKIGVINSADQAAAAKEVLKWDFIDSKRTAVWGWSGGGSMTLNLMFRYPEIYKTGVSVAPVGNQLLYDNIYQERYMGLPSENLEDFIEGSPVTYAKNLEGNLMLVHGTADDNVHYQNAEVVINELIKHNKQFDMMSYPNRSHGIHEGYNTRRHLYSLITRYLNEHTPPGPIGSEIRP